MTDLKTINRIISEPIKEHKAKEGTKYIREVIRIIGLNVTVKSQNAPGEPINRYTAFLGYPDLGKGFQKLIDNDVTVTAHIKLTNNRYEVTRFDVQEIEPENDEDYSDPGDEY